MKPIRIVPFVEGKVIAVYKCSCEKRGNCAQCRGYGEYPMIEAAPPESERKPIVPVIIQDNHVWDCERREWRKIEPLC